jgi:hypothetical protein
MWCPKPLIVMRRFSWYECALIAEAFCCLVVARDIVSWRPFRRLTAGLGVPMAESPITDAEGHRATIQQIGWAVQALGRRVPWFRQCLVRALAARWMLERRGIPSTLYFGTAKDASGAFRAHTWLRSGTRVLTGGQERRQFTVVATFASRVSEP